MRARAYPGEPEERQPVHTVYGGAHLFRADSAPKLGALALAALDEYAPDARVLRTQRGRVRGCGCTQRPHGCERWAA